MKNIRTVLLASATSAFIAIGSTAMAVKEMPELLAATNVVSHTVTAKAVSIIDDDGKERILMQVSSTGLPIIVLKDPKGKARAYLSLAGGDRGTLAILNESSKEVAEVFQDHHSGNGMVRINNQSGDLRAAMIVDQTDTGAFVPVNDEALKALKAAAR